MGSGYFHQKIYRRVGTRLVKNQNLLEAWSRVHEVTKLIYIYMKRTEESPPYIVS